jgi:NADH-quinone oxidoreductase subunit D
MNTETALNTAGELLASWIKESTNPEPHRLDVGISPDHLLAAAKALAESRWGYLSAITGLDLGAQNGEGGELEALYHFCAGRAVLTLRVKLPYLKTIVPSICEFFPYASLYERELMEMFGIWVSNTPNSDRLFLPDDWPVGVYPLRKAFNPADLPAPKTSARLLETAEEGELPPRLRLDGDEEPQPERFIVPIGPQHPALKEPGHFEFTVDGEIVTGATVRLGYVHRGIEKATEERNWVQNLYLLERVCGICSHTHAMAYCLAVEQLAGVEVPPRAQAIRELVAGLERIHSHLLWLGVAAHEAGFDTLFMYSWRDRETVMDLLENLSGNRVNYSANVLGGVKCDVDHEQHEAIRKGMDFLEGRCRHYLDIVTTDVAFLQRTRGIGVMTAEQAEQWGVLGPTARASGIIRDIRVEAPYGAYERFPVSIVTDTAGDLEARFSVRIKELFVSYNVIRTILDHLPEGDLAVRMPRKIPAGEAISRVEAPRGELLYFVKSGGGEKPERIKARTPSITNFTSVSNLVVGHQLADVPLILAGIDPCFSCNDRMVSINRKGSQPEACSWERLRQHGINHYKGLQPRWPGKRSLG